MKLYFRGNSCNTYVLRNADDLSFPSKSSCYLRNRQDTYNGKSLSERTFRKKLLTFLSNKLFPNNSSIKKNTANRSTERPEYEYKNIFHRRLKSNINPSLRYELAKDPSVHNVCKATKRLKSLSKYLKEYMVGFITPDGEHWFEQAMPYILNGAASRKLKKSEFIPMAKEFWGLLAKADHYWKSEEFVDYLTTLNSSPEINATIKAIRMLQNEDSIFIPSLTFSGRNAKIKYIPELLICAYSGRKLKWGGDEKHRPSSEHLMPRSLGGEELDSDLNYIISSSWENNLRGNIPLIAFLKGWDFEEYKINH
ncbi:MAG: hypothetical protein AB1782_17220 [Cyanobacteriota bacterium]